MNGNTLQSRLVTSRSGRHGERVYKIVPGEYIMYDAQKSNLGNVYITIRYIKIDEQCEIKTINEWILYTGKTINIPIEKLPQDIQKILIRNRDSLPLFDYVYW